MDRGRYSAEGYLHTLVMIRYMVCTYTAHTFIQHVCTSKVNTRLFLAEDELCAMFSHVTATLVLIISSVVTFIESLTCIFFYPWLYPTVQNLFSARSETIS